MDQAATLVNQQANKMQEESEQSVFDCKEMIIVSGLILQLKCWFWGHLVWNLMTWDLIFQSLLMGLPALIKQTMNSQIGW